MFQNKGLGFIKDNRIFKGVDDSDLNLNVNQKDILVIKEGDIIYSNSDAADAIFLILEGEIKLKLGHKNVIRYRQNDYFGEKEILERTERLSSAIANTDCKLYPLRRINELLSNKTILHNINIHVHEGKNRNQTGEITLDILNTKEVTTQPELTVQEELPIPTPYDIKLENDLEKIVSEPLKDDFNDDNFDYESFNKQLTHELEIKEKAAMEMNSKVDDEEDIPANFWNLSEEEPVDENPIVVTEPQDEHTSDETIEILPEAQNEIESIDELDLPSGEFSFKELDNITTPHETIDDNEAEIIPTVSWDFTGEEENEPASFNEMFKNDPHPSIDEPDFGNDFNEKLETVSWDFTESEEENTISNFDEVEAINNQSEVLIEEPAVEELHIETPVKRTLSFNDYINSVSEDISLQIRMIKKATEKFKSSDYHNPVKFVDIIVKETEVLEDYFKLLNEFFSENITLSKNFFQTDIVLNEILVLNAEYLEEKKINLFKSFNTESLLNVDIKKLYFAFYLILKYASHLLKDGGDINISAVSRLDVSYIELSFNGDFNINEDIFDNEALKDDSVNFTGLQIAKKVIEAHKGNISFISHEGINTFTVELPYIKFNQD